MFGSGSAGLGASAKVSDIVQDWAEVAFDSIRLLVESR